MACGQVATVSAGRFRVSVDIAGKVAWCYLDTYSSDGLDLLTTTGPTMRIVLEETPAADDPRRSTVHCRVI
jgi:hypothetical protein